MTKVQLACGVCGQVTGEPHYDYDGEGGMVAVLCDACAVCDRLNFPSRCEGCWEREYHA